MSATRKLLLVLSVLIGLLGLFKVYDIASSTSSEVQARGRERNLSELRTLEAGEPPPNGVKLDKAQREARIRDLRSWTSHAEEDGARDRENDQRSWRSAILTLLLSGGLAGAVVVLGRKDGPAALVRARQLRPGVIVAGLVGLLAGTLLVSFARETLHQQQELTRTEQRVSEVQTKLKTFEFEANGNVAPDKRTEFEQLMLRAKLDSTQIGQAAEQRNLAMLIALGSTVALALAAFFGRRSWKQSFNEVEPGPAVREHSRPIGAR